jgi:hypothetical protein
MSPGNLSDAIKMILAIIEPSGIWMKNGLRLIVIVPKDGSGCISNRLCRPLMVAATPAKIGKIRSYAIEGA